MFIRLISYARNQEEAMNILEDVLSSFEISKREKINKIEPYWKIEGTYLIEANVYFEKQLGEQQLNSFFYEVSDKWTFFGNPVNEALASETTAGCNYLKKGISMINIVY